MAVLDEYIDLRDPRKRWVLLIEDAVLVRTGVHVVRLQSANGTPREKWVPAAVFREYYRPA